MYMWSVFLSFLDLNSTHFYISCLRTSSLQQLNSKKNHLVDTQVPSSLGGMSAVILTLSCGWRYWQSCSHCRLSLRLEEEVKEAVGTSHSLLPDPATNTATEEGKVREQWVNIIPPDKHTGSFTLHLDFQADFGRTQEMGTPECFNTEMIIGLLHQNMKGTDNSHEGIFTSSPCYI